jgi:hypothetical protein
MASTAHIRGEDDQEATMRRSVPAMTAALDPFRSRSRARALAAPALACLLASACIGDGDDDDRVPIGSEEIDPEGLETSDEVVECREALSGPREENASLEFGAHRADIENGDGTEHAVRVYIDDCLVVATTVSAGSSAGYGGYRAGEHTLRVFFDGKEVANEVFVTEPRDVFFAQMDVEKPNVVYTGKGNILDPPADRWRTYIMNIGAPDLILSRVLDPDDENSEVEPLVALAQGELFSGDIPVSAEHGVVLRAEQDGEETWNGQIGPFDCGPGEFKGGLTVFWAYDAAGPSSGALWPDPEGDDPDEAYCNYPG